jgi:xanthine dehydrogenase accessory factor
MAVQVFLRGGGDLASGVALRLFRAGIVPLILELSQPLVVRRMVSFAEAVYTGEVKVEEVIARRAEQLEQALLWAHRGVIPVLIDPDCRSIHQERLGLDQKVILVDGRMTKRPPGYTLNLADFIIGLGPGFTAGLDSHAVVETQRGHFLGRVIWEGGSEPDTGLPEGDPARVLRATTDGVYLPKAQIGDHLEMGERVASIAGIPLLASIRGVLRGSLHPGLHVQRGMKVGDIDPRDDPRYCSFVSDKALAIGGGVLEAILAQVDLRSRLWD